MAENLIAGMRVVITGAGLVGSRLAERLVAGGAESVRVVDRADDRLAGLADGVEPRPGDVADHDSMKREIAGAEIVFHTAGLLEGNDVAAYHRVNHLGTETVAAAAAAAGAGRMVHVSSVAVYGFATGDLTEDLPITPTAQAYSQSKSAGEQAAMRIGAERGLPVTAIRPSGIFGPGSRFFTGTFMKRASRRPIRMVGSGDGSQPVVFVDDVVDLLVVAATHRAAPGEVFNCSIDPPPTQREYVGAYGSLIGNRSFHGIPAGLIAVAGSIVVPFAKRGTYARQLPQNLRRIDSRVRFVMDKAAAVLGWRPRFDVEAGVDASVPWLLSQGLLDAGRLVGARSPLPAMDPPGAWSAGE